MSVEQQRHVGPSNDIQEQIYDGMLSWEICPQSTSRMTVLSSQLLYIAESSQENTQFTLCESTAAGQGVRPGCS